MGMARVISSTRALGSYRPEAWSWLGITIGIVMPVLSAVIYPVYMHQMEHAWAEWTRLMELPFVACELVIIHVALKRGYSDTQLLQSVPSDVRISLMLMVIGAFASSVFVSKMPAASTALAIITIVHLRFLGATFFLIRAARIDVAHWFRLLGGGLLVLALLTAWKFNYLPAASSVPGGVIELRSAVPGFIDVRHFGSWAGAIAGGLMISLLYTGRKGLGVGHLLYVLAAALTCWSGTRAAVLAMALVGILTVLATRRLPSTRAIMVVGLLSLIALGIGMALAPVGLPEFGLFARTKFSSANALTTGRDVLWSRALMRWLDAPLFGWGGGSSFWELGFSWTPTQPHNVIVQFLLSWGLVGAVGGLWLLGRAIAATWRIGFNNDELRPLTAMLYTLLLMSLVEGMLYYPRFIMAIMISFAVIFAKLERIGRNQRSGDIAFSAFSRASNSRLRSAP